MITSEMIDEWLKEIEQRPASAALIIQHIANRLADLTRYNEEILAENIALLNGKRVEEYEHRIAHLEYQLELLKRRFGAAAADGESLAAAQTEQPQAVKTIQLLIYTSQGRVHHLPLHPETLSSGSLIATLPTSFFPAGELPRLLAAPREEELFFLFTSGRVSTLPTASIPETQNEALTPDEPRAGETLACLLPAAKMALADYFVQVSRRGYVKKIGMNLAPSILSNHYIGAGVEQRADRAFELALCNKEERLILVSREGYWIVLPVKLLPFAIEEAMRLGVSDHLAAAFVAGADQAMMVMTQIGKVIHKPGESLETAASLKTKGQAVFSQQRREQGVRVVGAAAVSAAAASAGEWCAALHADGRLLVYSLGDVLNAGALPAQSELIAFTTF